MLLSLCTKALKLGLFSVKDRKKEGPLAINLPVKCMCTVSFGSINKCSMWQNFRQINVINTERQMARKRGRGRRQIHRMGCNDTLLHYKYIKNFVLIENSI